MNRGLAFLDGAISGIQNIGCGVATAIKSRFNGEGGKEEEVKLSLEDMGIYDMKEPFKGRRIMQIRGREPYFEMVINSFLKKKKHNVVLIGSPGVGKEAIVEGIAERIVKGKVPEELKDKEVWKLDVDKFITGDYTDAGIPVRLKALQSLLKAKGNVILYLYPLYVLPEYKIVNDIAVALEGTGVRVIGTMSQGDFTENSDLFQDTYATETVDVLSVVAPKLDELYEILKFKVTEYARYHGVTISRNAFEKCVSEVYRLASADMDLDELLDYIDSSATIAKLRGKKELDYQSILEVQRFQVVDLLELSQPERMKLAMHEAAHAVVGVWVEQPPKTVSIIPGPSYLGINIFEEKFKSMNRSVYVDMIAVYLASIASNMNLKGEENNEGGGDLKLATVKAKNMILNFGMSRKENHLGLYQSYVTGDTFDEEHFSELQKEELAAMVDEILKEGLQKAKTLLKDDEVHAAQLRVAEALCRNASLTEKEVIGLCKGTLSLEDIPDANLSEIK